MARKIIEQLVDDLDGSVLETGEGEVVSFALDGKSYELDLSDAHAQELRGALAPYVEKARRTGGSPVRKPRQVKPGTGQQEIVRAWARENGLEVASRGRISATIQAAYEAAQK